MIVIDPDNQISSLRVTEGGLLRVASGGLSNDELREVPLDIRATPRVCLGTARCTLTPAVQTLAQATGAPIPAGAVTCEIQADGGTVRLRRDGGVPSLTLGYRLDDGVEKLIDSALPAVRLISGTASTVFANIAYFDRV